MPAIATDLRSRLRYVLHKGLVDIRNLAMCGGFDEQIADLADVLEFLPKFLDDDCDLECKLFIVEEQFAQYQRRYPMSNYDYNGILDGRCEIPDY